MNWFMIQNMKLKPGDIVFLYTDGVTEAMNPEGRFFSEKKLEQVLAGLKDKNITDIVHGIKEEIKAFVREAPQSDDITMLILKYNGKET